ncbi:hypothetical protein BO85DRAFT_438173 [Aspergillus piperis CBS 112811]|uniref:Uncharacterized protein n=1 Tax=Aspergillus piperis CBS 112811 TaxID=1448313 RepID=A0A8G1R1P6_9EURO|nr:hypothetical protein BO85DRAFT_438173 [Aspergillus piperis CBS 112811]RAH57943.1 hypothetical protein BO85DRAFT_438173 [Aspergillus piperis CBS 112811]
MPSEAADEWPKTSRQKAAKKAQNARRAKHEAMKKRTEHARQHRTKPDLSKGLFKSQPENDIANAGSTSQDWDLETLSAEEEPRVIGQLIRVWGALPTAVADVYPDRYLPVWELLVKKEQDWNVVVNWINSAVLARCGRQALKGKCVPRVLGCDLLKALNMQSPVEPVSNEDLSMINGKFNRLGLITLAATSYEKGKKGSKHDA